LTQLLKMGPIRIPETSVRNTPTLRNIPEDDRIQVNRSESLRSRMWQQYENTVTHDKVRLLALNVLNYFKTHGINDVRVTECWSSVQACLTVQNVFQLLECTDWK
jgi:hypothetical protein